MKITGYILATKVLDNTDKVHMILQKSTMKISDRLCIEHGLSVVENPKQKGKSYKEWDARWRGKSWKGRLQETIDRLLPDSDDFKDFLYNKTREVYAVYRKSRHKKEFRSTHESDLALHESAKAAFEALGGAPIPKVVQLSEEYATLVSEKKQCYKDYKTARKMMIDLRLAHHKQSGGCNFSLCFFMRAGAKISDLPGSKSHADRRVSKILENTGCLCINIYNSNFKRRNIEHISEKDFT